MIAPSAPVSPAPRRQVVAAHCKLNLTLDVSAPRSGAAADGFHDLDSVVVLLSPADEVTVTTWEGRPRGIRLIIKGADGLPRDSRNLAYRAAQAFLDRFAPEAPVSVTIKLAKRLPFEAGLGGGSSDAAAVLRALSELLPRISNPTDLRAVAAGIGSDVPLFLEGQPVRMRGRGEIVEPLAASVPPLFGVLVKPGVGVPTGPAYALLDALPDRAPGDATPRLLNVLAASENADTTALGAALSNDFERAVLPAFPEVAEAHRAVTEAGAVRALLCGSGSAIFGLARDRHHARDLTVRLIGKFPWVKMATSVPPTVQAPAP